MKRILDNIYKIEDLRLNNYNNWCAIICAIQIKFNINKQFMLCPLPACATTRKSNQLKINFYEFISTVFGFFSLLIKWIFFFRKIVFLWMFRCKLRWKNLQLKNKLKKITKKLCSNIICSLSKIIAKLKYTITYKMSPIVSFTKKDCVF